MATERSPRRQRGANDRDARWRVKRVSRPCGTAGARGRGTRRRKARIGVGSRGRGWTRGWARGWRGPARDGACWLGGGLRALPEPGAGPRARPPPPRRPLRGLAPSRALGSGWGGRSGAGGRRRSPPILPCACSQSISGSRPSSVLGGRGRLWSPPDYGCRCWQGGSWGLLWSGDGGSRPVGFCCTWIYLFEWVVAPLYNTGHLRTGANSYKRLKFSMLDQLMTQFVEHRRY